MGDPTLGEFLALVHGRRGHFQLESGYHGDLWLDLDGLFGQPRQIAPFVAVLADRLRHYAVEVVCGPLLGGALLAHSLAAALDTEFCYTQQSEPSGNDGLFRARYGLPNAFRSRVQRRRVAIVDDVMSAGSSLRATHAELRSCEAMPVVVGALLILGDVGARYFVEEQRLPVEGAIRDAYRLWEPSECPLCAQGVPLEIGSEEGRGA